MKTNECPHCTSTADDAGWTRRDLIGRGLKTLGVGAGLPLFLRETSLAMALNEVVGTDPTHPERILVVLELSGGNDGLNTVVPYTDDEYYKARPTIAVAPGDVLKLDDRFGFHPNLLGWERLFKDGQMAVVHGCSYPNPNRSHFVSMEFWHTGVPHGAEPQGWLGRFADRYQPDPEKAYIVNIAKEQTRAVASGRHAPVVFSDPDRFVRQGSEEQKMIFKELEREREAGANPSLDFVRGIATTAGESSEFIRTACAEYRSQVDYGYGEVGVDMKRISAMIAAEAKTRIYYASLSGFDTHVAQAGAHGGLFNRVGDAVYGFMQDMERIGRADDVSVLLFTEFGRRVKENASRGTDHGVASPMFIVGKGLSGGLYGEYPSLTDLDEGDLKMTTDFRSVYATMMKEWMAYDDTKSVLRGDFPTLEIFS